MLYTIYILLVMVIMPILSIIVERGKRKLNNNSVELSESICKWFIFWALGVRGLTAGLSQMINPDFTASMLQLEHSQIVMIQELGIANTAMGIVSIISISNVAWRKQGAFVSGLFLGGCTILHIMRTPIEISFTEIMAMISDVWAVLVAVVYIVYDKRDRN